MNNTMRFVVTGCARSGTKYVSRLLTYSGMLTGHEDVFNRWGPGGALPEDWRDDTLDGDSSFIAAPHAAALAEADLAVVHLVREPLDVIASITAMGWLADLNMPYVAYVAMHAPEVAEQPPGPRRAAAYWLGWNALVADHAHLTWRTSRIGTGDLADLGEHTALKVTRTRVRDAIARVSRRTNHKHHTTPVALDDLGALADDVAAAAERYGVDLTASEPMRLYEAGLVTEAEVRRDNGPLDDGTVIEGAEARVEAGA